MINLNNQGHSINTSLYTNALFHIKKTGMENKIKQKDLQSFNYRHLIKKRPVNGPFMPRLFPTLHINLPFH
jgi:hypothetical protein